MSRNSLEKRIIEGITFEFLGRGSFNNAFVATLDRDIEINGCKFLKGQKIVYKEIRRDEDSRAAEVAKRELRFKTLSSNLHEKEASTHEELISLQKAWLAYIKSLAQFELDSNDRLIRLWNTYNKNLEFPAQALGDGYIVPYVEGDKPFFEEIADFCLDFFTEYQRVILDPHVKDNFRRTEDDTIVPIDFGQFLLVSIDQEEQMKSVASLNYINFFRDTIVSDFQLAIDLNPELMRIFNVTKALLFLQENFPGIKDVSQLKENHDFMNILAGYYDAVKAEFLLAGKEIREVRKFHFNEVRLFFGLEIVEKSFDNYLDLPSFEIANSPFLKRERFSNKNLYEALLVKKNVAKNTDTETTDLYELTEIVVNGFKKKEATTKELCLMRDILIALVDNKKTPAESLEKLIILVQKTVPCDQWILKRIVKHPNMNRELFEKLVSLANKKLLLEIKAVAEKKLSGSDIKNLVNKISVRENSINEKNKLKEIKNNIINMIDNYLIKRFGYFEKRSKLLPIFFLDNALIKRIENLLNDLKKCADDDSLMTVLVAARQDDKLKDIHGLLSSCGQLLIFRLEGSKTGSDVSDLKR